MKKTFIYTAFLMASLSLAACGGGSSGGGGGAGISYTGLTTQAAVDAANGQAITSGAIDGGSVGGVAAAPSANGAPSGGVGSGPLSLRISETIKSSVEAAYFPTQGPALAPQFALRNASGSIAGDCGGSASYLIRADDVTGDFTGTFNYSSYCSFGSIMSGVISVSGKFNAGLTVMEQMTIGSTGISMTIGGTGYTFSGSIVMDYLLSTATMNFVIKERATGKTSKGKNLTYVNTPGVGFMDVDIAGLFYHPDHGYITLSTPTQLRYTTGASYPSAGVMIATGTTNSKARLTVIDGTQVTLEVDADGDNVYESNLGTILWTAL